eukprot:1146625-Pelagomonas_calceolata.AAC.1
MHIQDQADYSLPQGMPLRKRSHQGWSLSSAMHLEQRWMAAFFQATKPLLHSWQGSSSSSGSSRRNDEQGSATSNDGGGESLLHSTVRRSSTLSETEHGWQSEGSLHAVIADTGGQACAEQHQPGVLLGLACARGAGAPKACELENEESSSTADAGKPGAQDGVNGPVGSLGAHKEHDHYGSPQGLLEDEEVRKRATTKSSSSLHVSSKFGLVFEGLLTGLAVLHVQPPEDWLDAFFGCNWRPAYRYVLTKPPPGLMP